MASNEIIRWVSNKFPMEEDGALTALSSFFAESITYASRFGGCQQVNEVQGRSGNMIILKPD